jgi:hypothetical protein
MDMTVEAWRVMFQNWPDTIPPQGMIKTKQDDLIPFTSFLVHSSLLLLDRGKPDAQGARKVILPMDQISALKLAGTQEISAYEPMGFQKPF